MKAVVRMPDIYIEDVLTPNYDGILLDVLDHRHNRYIFKGGRGSLKSSFCGTVIPLVMIEPDTCGRSRKQRKPEWSF